MNVITLEDRRLSVLRRRVAAHGMEIVKESAGVWALVTPGLPKPEERGSLAVIGYALDQFDGVDAEPNGDILLG